MIDVDEVENAPAKKVTPKKKATVKTA